LVVEKKFSAKLMFRSLDVEKKNSGGSSQVL